MSTPTTQDLVERASNAFDAWLNSDDCRTDGQFIADFARAHACSEVAKVEAERDALRAEVERLRAFVQQISKQIPERPDYWNSCGQCERNSEDAKELLEGGK